MEKQKEENVKKYDLNKWFVPSKSEWAAFGDFVNNIVGVSQDNYPDYNLKEYYWSSTLCSDQTEGDGSITASETNFAGIGMWLSGLNDCNGFIRLSTTF